MTIRLETFKGNAGVFMDLRLPSGYWDVRRRNYAGEVVDKMVFDTKAFADECFDDFVRDALMDEES